MLVFARGLTTAVSAAISIFKANYGVEIGDEDKLHKTKFRRGGNARPFKARQVSNNWQNKLTVWACLASSM